jgi:hypothetical protein
MPRGGRRPGAGAPRGNLNALTRGNHSRRPRRPNIRRVGEAGGRGREVDVTRSQVQILSPRLSSLASAGHQLDRGHDPSDPPNCTLVYDSV